MIERKEYLIKIQPYINTNLVKIITWVRRSWKTYFMKQVIDFICRTNSTDKKNIVYIDKEDLQFDFIKNYKLLYDYVEEKKKNIVWKLYLFIDEIQDIPDWEKTIRNYAKDDNFDIYITGSNSNLLSWELATFLTWRYIELHIYPLNFKEFLEFRKISQKAKKEDLILKNEFRNYIKYGWLPCYS